MHFVGLLVLLLNVKEECSAIVITCKGENEVNYVIFDYSSLIRKVKHESFISKLNM